MTICNKTLIEMYTGSSEEEIRVPRTAFQPMTFWLTVQMLSH